MKNITIIISMIFMSALFSQTVIEGTPYSFKNEVSNTIQDVVMPQFDVDAMLLEDEEASSGTPFRYGKIFDVDYNMDNIGSSTRIGRAYLMAEAPNIDANEITDKGYLNQRAVLARRADLVELLYSDAPSVVVFE